MSEQLEEKLSLNKQVEEKLSLNKQLEEKLLVNKQLEEKLSLNKQLEQNPLISHYQQQATDGGYTQKVGIILCMFYGCLLEVKLPYDPVCPSFGRSVFINSEKDAKFNFYRRTISEGRHLW